MNAIELAWAAGFFDGEGNFRWNQGAPRPNRTRTYGTLRAQLAQIDRRVLDRFCGAVGVGKVRGPYLKKGRGNPDYFVYSASGREAVHVFNVLEPYLSPIKQAQWHEAYVKFEEQEQRPLLPLGRKRKTNGS